jgi:hypothetical protein
MALLPRTVDASDILGEVLKHVIIFSGFCYIGYFPPVQLTNPDGGMPLREDFVASLAPPPPLEELSNDDVCLVCRDEQKDPVELVCRHIYCRACILLWIETDYNKNNWCPYCHRQLSRSHFMDDVELCLWKVEVLACHQIMASAALNIISRVVDRMPRTYTDFAVLALILILGVGTSSAPLGRVWPRETRLL